MFCFQQIIFYFRLRRQKIKKKKFFFSLTFIIILFCICTFFFSFCFFSKVFFQVFFFLSKVLKWSVFSIAVAKTLVQWHLICHRFNLVYIFFTFFFCFDFANFEFFSSFFVTFLREQFYFCLLNKLCFNSFNYFNFLLKFEKKKKNDLVSNIF